MSSQPTGTEGEAPSKNALKKAQKEKEKAEKKAQKAQQQQGESSQVPVHDTASHLYGNQISQNAPRIGNFLNVLQGIEHEEENSTVTFIAQVQSSRKQSAKLAFLVLSQYEHSIQAVTAEGGEHGISRQMIKWCSGIPNQSIVRVTATVFKPKDPVISCSISNYEAHIQSIYMISEAAQVLPVQPKDCDQPPYRDEEEAQQDESTKDGKDVANASLKARLDHRVLSMRPPSQVAITKINEAVYDLFTEFMKSRGFTYIISPSFAGAATEGGANVFEVKYFETKAYLTQSPQFYKQMAIAGGKGPVYLVGPVFRAENSNTKRHLTEFTGLDFEMPINTSYHEVLDLGESLLLFIIRQLQTRPPYRYWTSILQKAGYTDAGNFQLPSTDRATRLTFSEAKSLLVASGYDIGPNPHDDIDTSQEKALGEIILSKHQTHFFTIDKYPRSLRPFYTHPDHSNPELTNGFDFFMRGQEIMSGAQRIHDHGELCANMRRLGLDPEGEGFKDYTDSFRYGCVPHGGGGVGLNRVVQFYLGLNNVREATLFPRDPQRLAP